MKSVIFLFLCLYLSGCVQTTGYTPSYILSDANQEVGEERASVEDL